MPLIKGKSDKTRNKNIGELLHSYKEKGSIGTSKPQTMKDAISQASAIGYSMQKKMRKK